MRLASVQRAVDVVWPFFGGGCHASRDTLRAITDAGFAVEHVRRFSFRPCVVGARSPLRTFSAWRGGL